MRRVRSFFISSKIIGKNTLSIDSSTDALAGSGVPPILPYLPATITSLIAAAIPFTSGESAGPLSEAIETLSRDFKYLASFVRKLRLGSGFVASAFLSKDLTSVCEMRNRGIGGAPLEALLAAAAGAFGSAAAG